MAWIHHPELAVDAEVPDETAEIWFGEPGWRPGTVECPEPWEPQQFDADGNPTKAATGFARGKGVGVRLGVKTTGCSGLAYKLEYVDETAPEDIVFEEHGVKLLIDPKSLAYIDGTQLDFVREGLNEGFRFNNPNERDRCGCGESFRV